MITPDHALLAARIILGAALFLAFVFGSLIACALSPKLCIWGERLQIWWREHRRPLARCVNCGREFRGLEGAIKHECPLQ